MKKFFKQITEWEFWPWYIMYIPIYLYWLWGAIKSQSLMYHYIANPGMPPTGLLRFSKWHILKQLDARYLPQTFLVDRTVAPEILRDYLHQLGGVAIIKPDIGERGNNVKKITSLDNLLTYLATQEEATYLLQQFIDYPLEYGVMRYRYPGETKGHISGIVQKVPLIAVGDGNRTLEQIILDDERLARYEELFRIRHQRILSKVLADGEEFQLSDIGNHCKGARFYDTSDCATDGLLTTCDWIADQIEGFHFGRFDFKVPSVEDFKAGKNIIVLEVNGVQSEPAHIYDADYSLKEAYKQLFSHRKTIYTISTKLHQQGVSYHMYGRTWSHLFSSHPEHSAKTSTTITSDTLKP